MSSASPSPPVHPFRRPFSLGRGAAWLSEAAGSSALVRALLVAAGLVLVALIALLDYLAGPDVSLGILHLIPVGACAWWGGFPHGGLVAVAASAAWYTVDLLEHPATPPAAGLFNGVARLGALALACCVLCRLHTRIRREQQLARTDSLTGAANARTFHEAVAAEVERARRAGRPLTLAYLDLDNFKQLNDQLGHAAGDEALRRVVRTIQPNLRASDLLSRLGGDEFAVLLPETGAAGATALLTRVQGLLAREMTRKGWPVTLSVGAVTFVRPLWDVERMIRQADALMYSAKRQGKGQIEHAVVLDDSGPHGGEWRGAERRGAARVSCNRAARVRLEGREEPATIRDLSAGGVSLYLERPLPPRTVVVVESVSPDTRPLLAEVVRVAPEAGGWLHGCGLSAQMSGEDLHGWLDPGAQPDCSPG